jgi:hypothetical protein
MPVGPFISDWTRQVGLRKPTLMKGRSALLVALGEGLDYDNNRSLRHVKTYSGRVFNRDEPTRFAASAAALKSASLRNTVLFSLAIRAVVRGLP